MRLFLGHPVTQEAIYLYANLQNQALGKEWSSLKWIYSYHPIGENTSLNYHPIGWSEQR